MRFIRKIVTTCVLLAVVFYLGTVAADRQELQNNVIRLHVVADSDSKEDQQVKLQVRDALTAYLQPVLEQLPNMDAARTYLESQLPQLERIANSVLKTAGQTVTAAVSLTKEAFSKRDYDTFSLPSGVYESLRVTIGSGEGKNWWCVVFPSLCVGATTDSVEDTAVGAGFSNSLTGAIAGKEEYRVRFFVMDCLGWLENWIFG